MANPGAHGHVEAGLGWLGADSWPLPRAALGPASWCQVAGDGVVGSEVPGRPWLPASAPGLKSSLHALPPPLVLSVGFCTDSVVAPRRIT